MPLTAFNNQNFIDLNYHSISTRCSFCSWQELGLTHALSFMAEQTDTWIL